jgi:HEAT repeat protein
LSFLDPSVTLSGGEVGSWTMPTKRTVKRRVVASTVVFGATVLGGRELAEDFFIERLASSDADERARAARRLGELECARAAPALVALLSTSLEGLEVDFGVTIAEMKQPHPDERYFLIPARCGSSVGRLRLNAAGYALAHIGAPAAESLVAAVARNDDVIDLQVVLLFAEMTPPPALSADALAVVFCRPDDALAQLFATSALLRMGDHAKASIPYLRRRAEIGDESLQPFIASLIDDPVAYARAE